MDLHWSAEGAFRGSAVLLHGLGSYAATWWQIGPDLAAGGFDVIALDLPGHGDQPAGADPISQAVLVASVVDRLPATIGVDLLVGHSMGAVVAAGVAASRPDLVRALVMEDPPSWRGPATPPHVGLRERYDAARADPVAAREAIVATNPGWSADDVDHDLGGLLTMDVDAVAEGLAGQLRGDVLASFAQLTVPVLLLLAESPRSALAEPERSVMIDALPADRVQILPTGHCLHRDMPSTWVDIVLRFAGSLSGEPAALA